MVDYAKFNIRLCKGRMDIIGYLPPVTALASAEPESLDEMPMYIEREIRNKATRVKLYSQEDSPDSRRPVTLVSPSDLQRIKKRLAQGGIEAKLGNDYLDSKEVW